jgi:purine nucleoside permease
MRLALSCLAALALAALGAPLRAAPTAIPVLIVTTYETGKDTGDVPGELQYWVEREHLDTVIPVPGVDHPLLTNGHGLYAMVCGTTSRCAVQIMALAADPRFDLRKTYIIEDGICGGDPAEVSLASAAWITRVVDANPAFEIDSREIPADWPYGLVAFGAEAPGKGSKNVDNVPAAGADENGSGGVGTVGFKLNPALAEWAFQLTKDVPLVDNPAMKASRDKFTQDPNARRPPFVTKGFALAGDRFWHGPRMLQWARDWVHLYTRNTGNFMMSDCEDAGVCLALQRLERMGKVDFSRLLVLRCACNYVTPPPGMTPADGLFSHTVSESGGIAYLPALESCYRVGSVVSAALLRDWAKYQDQEP